MAYFEREPAYVTQCTLPINLINPEKKGTEDYRVSSICDRKLTMTHIANNECPGCHRPLRQYASLAEERKSKNHRQMP
jgi:hypothetical protein